MITSKDDTQNDSKKLEGNIDQKKTSTVPQKMETNETGSLVLMKLQDQMAYAKRLIDEKMVSSSFTSANQVMIGIQYALSLKMDPIIALNMMYVLNNKPVLYGDGPKMLCSRNNMVEYFREYFIDDKGEEIKLPKKGQIYYGAVTEVKRRGEDGVQKDWFTWDDVEKAGLNHKDVYKKYPRHMMRARARYQALKSKFADILQGQLNAEYDFNTMIAGGLEAHPEDRTPKSEDADGINKLLDA